VELFVLKFKHFWVDILGFYWPGENLDMPFEHRLVRMRFTRRVLFDFQQLSKEYQQAYRNQSGSDIAIVIDVDAAKELCARYRSTPQCRTKYSACVYPPAKLFSRQLFELAIGSQKVKRVLFLAGGTASGKSSVIAVMGQASRELVIMDGTLSDHAVAHNQVWRCIANGKFALIVYIYTPIEAAMTRAVDRALDRGRVVAISVFSQTHFKSQVTVRQLRECHADELNFAFRSISGLTRTELGFETIPQYESINDVQTQAEECFERELCRRGEEGSPVPEDIVAAFRKTGRKVGG